MLTAVRPPHKWALLTWRLRARMLAERKRKRQEAFARVQHLSPLYCKVHLVKKRKS